MTPEQLVTKIQSFQPELERVRTLPLKQLERLVKGSMPNERIVEKLELKYRLEGGQIALDVILDKLGTTHGYHIGRHLQLVIDKPKP